MKKFMPRNSTIIRLAAAALLILLASPASASFQTPQDIQFRLINLERRIDQLQQRVDFLERSIQNKAAVPAVDTTVLTQSILETQRQQLVLAEQVVMMQKQMLEMQKKIDQLSEKKK